MNKFPGLYLRCVLTLALLLLGFTHLSASGQANNKKILVINSYHAGYRGSDDILAGFGETVRMLLPTAEIKVEYLDSMLYSGAEFDRRVLDSLTFKYRKQKFDLVVATDDYAFNILDKHRDLLFDSSPVVFCGTNNFDPFRLANKPDFTGIDERPSFTDTLDLIFSLHPATMEIVVIHDDSITGQRNSADFRKAATLFASRARFSYRSGKRLDELVRDVGRLPQGAVAIYFASFVQGQDGERISSVDALRAISAASSVPIYGGWEFNLGKGIVGGRLINLKEHGRAAAELAARILRGETVADKGAVLPSPNQFMFDHDQLRRFRIKESALPAGSIVINRPPDFYQTYGNALLVILSTTLFLLVVFVSVKLLKKGRELKRSELKFSTIFRTSPDLIAITEMNSGRFLEVNEAFERIMGYARDEVVGRTSLELGTWASAEERKEMLQALKGSPRLMNYKTRFRRKNGEVFTALISLDLVKIQGIECFIISARDISDREQAEMRLKESEERFRSYITNSPHAIFVVDEKGRYLEVNPAACSMTGFTQEELLRMSIPDLLPPETLQSAEEGFNNLMATDRTTGESAFRRKNGEIGYWSLAAVKLSPNRFIGFVTDITSRRQAERELKEAKDAAEVASRAKSEFLANMSHEIRTPMNGVLGMSQLLQMTDLNEEQLEYVDLIMKSGNNLLSLINDILDLSRIEAGKIVLAQADFSLRNCITQIVSTQQSRISGKGLSVMIQLPDDVPDALVGDQLRLKQLVLNLLGNAIKFTDRGTIIVSAGVIERHDSGVLLDLAVQDTGIGISREVLEHIFSPFAQADGTITRKYGGTGLGLAICSRLVELMGGTISVDSREGEGSTFHLILPFALATLLE